MLDSNAPLRGGKRDLYEGGIRVPTIAWWPGTIEPGSRTAHISRPRHSISRAWKHRRKWTASPTCRLSSDRRIGRSDTSTFTGNFTKGAAGRHVRFGDWKGIRLDVYVDPDAPVELYNLAEENDVAADHPEIVARIKSFMREAHHPNEHFRLYRK